MVLYMGWFASPKGHCSEYHSSVYSILGAYYITIVFGAVTLQSSEYLTLCTTVCVYVLTSSQPYTQCMACMPVPEPTSLDRTLWDFLNDVIMDWSELLADHTNGRTYAAVLCPSVAVVCKRCFLELLTAYMSYIDRKPSCR